MKFSATIISLALLLAGSVEAHAHVRRAHGKRGPSATYTPQPTATPAPAPAPSTAPRPPSNNGIKRGISFNDVGLTKNFNKNQISWAYNWDHSHSGNLPAGVPFYPMLWSSDSSHTRTWSSDAKAAIAAGSTHLLFVNEPDLGSQANMSPKEAAEAWMSYMEPFKGQATLVGPAITNGGAPMGTAWLDQFLSICSSCSIDALAIHIYDSATNVGYFKNYITDIGKKYGKPVLVTEFGASGSAQQQQAFLSEMIPFLDGLDSVTHYAYFMVSPGILVNGDSSLSPLGQTYVSA
ncbi:glycosyl hydrolase catalytic core-domain-containing protein [Cristinia sonorae]|uniref:Glycosyl hydrolase catalytic core-domain-containing protein n=1 Tax=Cristinia sonorae TaxID=1940300 RepID=A0A8K0XKJ2_9AGAR|nr:glycosyl hydrolase catalytic core-domain-containing protein [Cristinia sonorae]